MKRPAYFQLEDSVVKASDSSDSEYVAASPEQSKRPAVVDVSSPDCMVMFESASAGKLAAKKMAKTNLLVEYDSSDNEQSDESYTAKKPKLTTKKTRLATSKTKSTGKVLSSSKSKKETDLDAEAETRPATVTRKRPAPRKQSSDSKKIVGLKDGPEESDVKPDVKPPSKKISPAVKKLMAPAQREVFKPENRMTPLRGSQELSMQVSYSPSFFSDQDASHKKHKVNSTRPWLVAEHLSERPIASTSAVPTHTTGSKERRRNNDDLTKV